MAVRDADITIFGATGFTGQHVVREALASAPPGLRLAIAGRSASKLAALAASLGATERLAIVPADVSDAASLARMAQGTRLLLNCVGPFRHFGEPVASACAAAGTDYLDIAGEPEFIERIELSCRAAAAASGALMASAAGFDSVPADMGTLFAASAFAPPCVPSSVEAVIQVEAPLGTRIHFATWEAAVLGIGSVASLRQLRRQAAAAGLRPSPTLVGPRPKAPPGPAWDARLRAWTLPFPGADAAIVRRTQAALSAAGEAAVHFSARFAAPSAFAAGLFVAYGGLMMGLAKLAAGRALLLRFPGLFSRGLVSHEGPSQAQMDATRCTFSLFARGYSSQAAAAAGGPPDLEATAEVALGDPGYLYTSKMLLAAALTLLQERGACLAAVGGVGGVHTVGALFRRSSLLQRLNAAGVRFSLKQPPQPRARA